jgi:polysaccharide pyruvyl transferase WcaK-like protein
MPEAYKKIGLLDHMGWGNMGDAAVHEAFITNIIDRVPDAQLVSFSLYPEDTKKRHNTTAYPINWSYPGWQSSKRLVSSASAPKSRLKSVFKRCRILYRLAKPVHDFIQEFVHLIRSYKIVRSLDLLVISGGGQLCDLHPGLPYNVFKFCVLAKLSNKPVFIVGVGADLLQYSLSKFFAKWSVRLASYTSLRSVESQTLIRKIGVKNETHVCPDPAYALGVRDYVTTKRSDMLTDLEAQGLLRGLGCVVDCRDSLTARSSDTPKFKVGLNPMGFCDPRRWPRKDAAVYARYLDKLETFSSWLVAQNHSLELFTTDINTDIYAIEDLKERLRVGASSDTRSEVIVRPLLTLKELLLQMSSFDFVVTSKFHGVIFSHLLEKPVIALSYLAKIDDLMRTVGHDRYCMDIENFDVGALTERFKLLVEEKDHLASLFRNTSETYANALHTQFDNLFLADDNGNKLCTNTSVVAPECKQYATGILVASDQPVQSRTDSSH